MNKFLNLVTLALVMSFLTHCGETEPILPNVNEQPKVEGNPGSEQGGSAPIDSHSPQGAFVTNVLLSTQVRNSLTSRGFDSYNNCIKVFQNGSTVTTDFFSKACHEATAGDLRFSVKTNTHTDGTLVLVKEKGSALLPVGKITKQQNVPWMTDLCTGNYLSYCEIVISPTGRYLELRMK